MRERTKRNGFDPEIAGKGELDDDVLPTRGDPVRQDEPKEGGEGRGAENVPDEGVETAAALRRAEEET